MQGIHQAERGSRTNGECAGRGGITPGDVMGEVLIDKQQAEIFCFNAISALIKHRKGAMTTSQDAPDPGEQWMKQHGDIMVSVVKWMKVAFPEMESSQRMQKWEECIREVEHMGKPVPHCDHTVIATHLAELPEVLKDTLRVSLRNEIYTGVAQPESTTSAKASKTALQHSSAAWKQNLMRKFVQHGWVRAFPAELREEISSWCLLVSPTHYVLDQGRLVADLSNAGSNEVGQDTNSLSAHEEYDKSQVQCDYVDVVAAQLAQYIGELGELSGKDLASLKADIKSAFMRVPLDVRLVGTMAIEWDGCIFVFTRTPFGWKHATHTFSAFTRAIKMKVQAFKQNGRTAAATQAARLNEKWSRVAARQKVLWLLGTTLKRRAQHRWKEYPAFAYVDDLWAFTSHMGGHTKHWALGRFRPVPTAKHLSAI